MESGCSPQARRRQARTILKRCLQRSRLLAVHCQGAFFSLRHSIDGVFPFVAEVAGGVRRQAQAQDQVDIDVVIDVD